MSDTLLCRTFALLYFRVVARPVCSRLQHVCRGIFRGNIVSPLLNSTVTISPARESTPSLAAVGPPCKQGLVPGRRAGIPCEPPQRPRAVSAHTHRTQAGSGARPSAAREFAELRILNCDWRGAGGSPRFNCISSEAPAGRGGPAVVSLPSHQQKINRLRHTSLYAVCAGREAAALSYLS